MAGYFETLATPLLAGRNLVMEDAAVKPGRVLINRALADLLYPHTNPIGQWLVSGRDGSKPPTSSIIGLVDTAKFRRMQELSPPTVYALLSQDDNGRLVMFVRTFDDPSSVVQPAEAVIRQLGGGVPLIEGGAT